MVLRRTVTTGHTGPVLHLRVTCPATLTDQVERVLVGCDGVLSVVVQRGVVVAALGGTPDVSGADGAPAAERAPHRGGDLVEADVAREVTDHVLALLERAGLREVGTLTLSDLALVDGAAVAAAQERAPGQGVDAVVWRQLVESTREDSTLSVAYLVFMVVAALIAAVGLITDSQVLIVGAMVLGPEFSVLACLALSTVDRHGRGALAAARTLVVGYVVAAALTAAMVAALHALGLVPTDYLEGRRPLTAFITSPGVFAVLVALMAGVAGTVSLTASKSSTLVGVFISVTTVPALAEAAAAWVTGQSDKAVAAAVVLGENVVAIVVASLLTLLVQRALWARLQARKGEVDPQVTSEEPWQRLRRTGRAVRGRRGAGPPTVSA